MISGKDLVTPKLGILIKYNGSFNLDKLYKDAKAWFNKYKYDFTEKEYKEKQHPISGELQFEFNGERKVDDYAKFNITIKVLIIGLKKLDKNTYIGNFRVNLIAHIDLDYSEKWQYNPFKKFLFFIYNNYLIKNKIQNVYEDKLYEEVLDYETLIKTELGLL